VKTQAARGVINIVAPFFLNGGVVKSSPVFSGLDQSFNFIQSAAVVRDNGLATMRCQCLPNGPV
jgi:hypothetical protein